MHKKIKKYIPIDNKSVIDICSSSSASFATEQQRLEAMMFADSNDMSISTYYGNGFDNRNIFEELDLPLKIYSVKNCSRCDDWDNIITEKHILPLHLNKNGDLYIIFGFKNIFKGLK